MYSNEHRLAYQNVVGKESLLLQHNLLWRYQNVVINPFLSSRLMSKDKQYIKRISAAWALDKVSIGWIA